MPITARVLMMSDVALLRIDDDLVDGSELESGNNTSCDPFPSDIAGSFYFILLKGSFVTLLIPNKTARTVK